MILCVVKGDVCRLRSADLIEKFFNAAIKQNANDIHLTERIPPTLRIGGRMVRMKADPLSAELAVSHIRQAKESQIADEMRKEKNHGMVCYEESLRQLCVGKTIDYRDAIGFPVNRKLLRSGWRKGNGYRPGR